MSGNLSQSNRAETQGNVLAVLYPKTIQTVLQVAYSKFRVRWKPIQTIRIKG